jgi:hypothetical protein
MERLRVGDSIRMIHCGKREDEVCTIVDILEDYSGDTFVLKNRRGNIRLEIETPETILEKA